jgi:hypothetical protein
MPSTCDFFPSRSHMPCLCQHRSTSFRVTFDVTVSAARRAAACETADSESADKEAGAPWRSALVCIVSFDSGQPVRIDTCADVDPLEALDCTSDRLPGCLWGGGPRIRDVPDKPDECVNVLHP